MRGFDSRRLHSAGKSGPAARAMMISRRSSSNGERFRPRRAKPAAAARCPLRNSSRLKRQDSRPSERVVGRLILPVHRITPSCVLRHRGCKYSSRVRPTFAPGADTRLPPRDHGCVSSTLPAGGVTFLFTDVEGSTKLLHELGNAYADALHEHRRLFREAAALGRTARPRWEQRRGAVPGRGKCWPRCEFDAALR
jgi:class 3 adenylate cyclase